jgi:uncharacterized damage-inducible protein DinB
MPVPAVIATAAQEYSFNSGFLLKTVSDLTPEEWLRRPDGKNNHIAWIVGHLIWTRKAVLARLGVEWSTPWLGMFARGQKIDDGAAYPSADALVDAWKDVGGVLAKALESASEEAVAAPAPQPGPPSADGKVSGTIGFLAWHETYHVGQASYLRGWLGHKGLMG